jgi:transposase
MHQRRQQLDLRALHGVRERLVSQRTGIVNQICAFLLDQGIAVRQGLRFLRIELPSILAGAEYFQSQLKTAAEEATPIGATIFGAYHRMG